MIKTIVLAISIMMSSMVNANVDEYNNVGNGQEYEYQITVIEDNEIHGIPLNKMSDDNQGIFLYDNELDFNVNIGDKIVVIWGQYEDEFERIELIEQNDIQ
ncbi:hypothetical protein [Psychrobacillus phage Perkons]|nr:hypothetical protein [Psychrobacillus phage Perkons]